MLGLHQVIKKIRITEKATMLSSELNKYTFEVYPEANKKEIAYAVSELFSVKVKAVNVFNRKGKKKASRSRKGPAGRTAAKQIAIVTLKEGSTIEMA